LSFFPVDMRNVLVHVPVVLGSACLTAHDTVFLRFLCMCVCACCLLGRVDCLSLISSSLLFDVITLILAFLTSPVVLFFNCIFFLVDVKHVGCGDSILLKKDLPVHLYEPLGASVHAVHSSLGGSSVDAWARFVCSNVVLRSFAHFHFSITNNVLGPFARVTVTSDFSYSIHCFFGRPYIVNCS